MNNEDNLKVLVDTHRHLKDAAYNLRACWDGAESIAAENMLKHITEAESVLKMEIRGLN